MGTWGSEKDFTLLTLLLYYLYTFYSILRYYTTVFLDEWVWAIGFNVDSKASDLLNLAHVARKKYENKETI